MRTHVNKTRLIPLFNQSFNREWNKWTSGQHSFFLLILWNKFYGKYCVNTISFHLWLLFGLQGELGDTRVEAMLCVTCFSASRFEYPWLHYNWLPSKQAIRRNLWRCGQKYKWTLFMTSVQQKHLRKLQMFPCTIRFLCFKLNFDLCLQKQ